MPIVRKHAQEKWTEEKNNEVRRLWALNPSKAFVMKELGLRQGQMYGRIKALNLHAPHSHPMVLAKGHKAIAHSKSIFQTRVYDPVPGVLKSGAGNAKLGRGAVKGAWKGMPIYSLSLEERATCTRGCPLFRSCYGNHMHMAKRYRHGPKLLEAITVDLERLQVEHPNGFVVRLHVLGDFYSEDYVLFWLRAITKYPALRVFGYTAWQPGTKIGNLIDQGRKAAWSHFAVRFSNGTEGPRTKNVAGDSIKQSLMGFAQEPDVIVCPAQTGKSLSCSTCTLCWSAPDKVIGFIMH